MKKIYFIVLFLFAGITAAQEVNTTGTKGLNNKDFKLDMPI